MRSLVTGLAAGALAFGSGEKAKADLTPGDTVGNYRVERVIADYPLGQGFASDLEFHNGKLYALNTTTGIVNTVNLNTGAISPFLWIDGDSLHDDISFDNPRGLAFNSEEGNNDDGYMVATTPNSVRRFSTTGPTSAQNPTYVSEFFPLNTNSPMDLTIVNGSLYFPTYPDGKIVEFNPLSGQVIRSFDSPHYKTYAMTFDGQDLLMIHSEFGSDRFLTRMSLNGTILEQDQFQTSSLFQGLAYDIENRKMYASLGTGEIYSLIEIPEPSTFGMLAVGALAALGRKTKE